MTSVMRQKRLAIRRLSVSKTAWDWVLQTQVMVDPQLKQTQLIKSI